MFGTYRWFLAMLVIIGHFTLREAVYVSYYAVFGFFVLSGYLMTLVLHERYYHLPHGILRYCANRFFRVYPAYLAALIFSAVVIMAYPDQSYELFPVLRIPPDLEAWIRNLTIVGLIDMWGNSWMVRLIPQSWSLDTEVTLWLLMPLLCRSRDWLLGWTLFSLFVFGITYGFGVKDDITYYSPIGASIVFCAGSWLYHLHRRGWAMPRWLQGLSFLGLALVLAAGNQLFSDVYSEGLYIAAILQCGVIYALSGVRAHTLPPLFIKLDRLLGNIAYPLFLVHWTVGTLVVVFYGDTRPEWGGFLALIILFSHPVAFLLWYAVDHQLETLRIRIGKKERSPITTHAR